MTTRRLAEDTVQPKSFAFTPENAGWAEATIKKYPEGRQQSAVIPLLMRAQEQDGWVTKAAIENIAAMLSMPLIRVLEVATFYTQFQLKPVGTRAHVQVCGTTPCMLRGAEALMDACRSRIHPQQFHLNEAGTLSWEEVECLGACVNAPMVMIFKDTYEDLSPERLTEIIDLFEAGEGDRVKPGPQIDRHLSAPFGPLTSLTTADAKEGAEAGTDGPAETSRNAGLGEGQAVASRMGRPDTHAWETDPSIKAPGSGIGTEVRQAVENAASIDPSEGAERAGAGSVGGTRQGATGKVEEDSAHFGTLASTVNPDWGRHDGSLREKGGAAEAAIVQDHKFVDNDKGVDNAASRDADLTGLDQTATGIAEGQRRHTSDTSPGPVAEDHFDSAAEEPNARDEQ